MNGASDIREGAEYAHAKGGRYVVLAVAIDATNARDGNRIVIYRALADGNVYARDAREFLEPVAWPDGISRPRFIPADIG